MGRVSNTGYSKAFEGTANGVSDFNSIQKAIKGTITDTSLATKNMNTLANLARLDMFVPKRTNPPVDMASFRGFPQATINVAHNIQSADTSLGTAAHTFNFTFNNKVGYDVKIQINIEHNEEINDTSTQEVIIIPAGNTSFFATVDVPFTINNQFQTISINALDNTYFGETYKSTFYSNTPLDFTVMVSDPNALPPYISRNIDKTIAYQCGAPSVQDDITAYQDRSDDIAVNKYIYTDTALSTPLPSHSYRYYNGNSEFLYFQVDSNGMITGVITCIIDDGIS
jgi:hypothetical protein